MKEKTFKVAPDAAAAEFDRFVDAMDIDMDTAGMDAEDLTQFNKLQGRVLRAIERGALVINEDGEAVYTPCHPRSKHSEPLVFHERTGASLMAMDGKKKGHDVAKTYAVMADMCRVHPSVFAGLVGTDVKVCEALFSFLMD